MMKPQLKIVMGLCLALCLLFSVALANPAPAALSLEGETLLALGASYQAETGRYLLIAPETQAALDRLSSGALRAPTNTQAFFYLQLEADLATSRLQPMLVILAFGAKPLNAVAASLGVDNVRYDFPVHQDATQLGNLQAERLTVALDAQGLAMMKDLLDTQTVSLMLHGQSVARFDIAWDSVIRRKSGQPDWSDLARAALDGLAPMLARMEALGMDGYALYDQNQAVWKQETGTDIQVDRYALAPGQDAMADLWLPGDRGDEIQALQELLAANNLYYGPYTGSYSTQTQMAVTRVQTLAGLVATGAADARVWAYLESKGIPALPIQEAFPLAQGQDASLGQAHALGELATLSLNRYWYAKTVLPTLATDSVLGISVTNTDNVLLILDGDILNLSTRTLDLYWEMPATLIFDETYAFPCTLHRERDQGHRFDTQLHPLDSARLVLCAELPSAVMNSELPLRVEITLDTETVGITLR